MWMNMRPVLLTGSNWNDAFTDLQKGLELAAALDTIREIWVAAGTYSPTSGTDRHKSFYLYNQKELYGSFFGTETSRSQRDSTVITSILSGDIGIPDDSSDNSYHVLYGLYNDTTVFIGGFAIQSGMADDTIPEQAKGGGAYFFKSSPAIENCHFTGNYGRQGGGIASRFGDVLITNSRFSKNRAEQGAAIHNEFGTPFLLYAVIDSNSAANAGGGIYNDSAHTIIFHCYFHSNTAVQGGALYNHFSTPFISDNYFVQNKAIDGGAIFNENNSNASIRWSSFYLNQADRLGGAIYNHSSGVFASHTVFKGNSAIKGGSLCNIISDVRVGHCIFSGNKADSLGGALYNQLSIPQISNVTLNGNHALTGAGLYNINSNPTIDNSILWDNKDQNGFTDSSQVYTISGVPLINYSIVQGTWSGAGIGNLDTDPLFLLPTDPDQAPDTTGDVHPGIGAPSLNAAENSFISRDFTDLDDDLNLFETVAIDLEGNPRIQNGTVDMGVYEATPGSPIIFVDSAATGKNLGANWHDAFTDLQEALGFAANHPEVRQIWLAKGTYYPSPDSSRQATFQLRNNLEIYGAFRGTETELTQRDLLNTPTILSGDIGVKADRSDNSFHVVTANGTDRTAILDACIITGGNVSGSGAGILIENGSPTLRWCTFRENTASVGAALHCVNGSPLLSHCIFKGNHALSNGGALDIIQSAPIFSNCAFSGNRARFTGGAVHNDQNSQPLFSHCSFHGNLAETLRGGAVYNDGNSNPVFHNSILWGNKDLNGTGSNSQVYNSSGTPLLQSCLIASGWTGAGGNNIQGDPHFLQNSDPDQSPNLLGNLNLQISSPAIDAADNTLILTDLADIDYNGDTTEPVSTDLGGFLRVQGASADMGAYEWGSATVTISETEERQDIEVHFWPNPFREDIQVELVLKEKNEVEINLYNTYGMHVYALSKRTFARGRHRFIITPDAGSGIYYYQIRTKKSYKNGTLLRLN